MSAQVCVKCGHEKSEHRAEVVLPFAVCRHVSYREFPYAGAPFAFAGVATPCPCTSYELAAVPEERR